MAYIYQADIFCDECGQEICERIKREGCAPENPDDETSYDSDEYPKHANDEEETDSPQHCGSHDECLNAHVMGDGSKIGCLIGGGEARLTTDGVEYVKESIREALRDGENEDSSVALGVWAKEFSDYEVLETLDWSEVFDAMSDTLSDQKNSAEKLAELHNQVCTRRIAPLGDDFVYIDPAKE